MFIRIFILLLALFHVSCSSEVSSSNIEYIKVVILGDPDTITLYNKGTTIEGYLYYNRVEDSLVHGTSDEYNVMSPVTSPGLKDSLGNLINFLKWRPNGFVDSSTFSDGKSAYCGPTFYAILKETKAVHHYVFILSGNDTLDRFSDFFFGLDFSHEKKKSLQISSKYRDSMSVSVLKTSGYYEKMPTPYIGGYCDSTVDPDRIAGTWRTASTKYNIDSSTYTRLTTKKDGTLTIEKLVEGIVKYTYVAKFTIDPERNTLTMLTNGNKNLYEIKRLTEHCLEYEYRGKLTRYYRY